MLFENINPFIRYARYLKIERHQKSNTPVPLDARLFFVLEGEGKIQLDDAVI